MITKAQLQDIVSEAKVSHSWLLKSIKHKADELSKGNYSQELKHAIAVQELLEGAGE